MENAKSNKGVYAIIILLMIAIGLTSYRISLVNDELDKMSSYEKIETEHIQMKAKLTDVEEANYVLKNDIFVISKDMADLWTSIQTNETQEKIKEWDEANTNFHACSKKLEKIDIFRDFLNPKDSKPFNHLVVIFEKGYQVYYNNGTVNCYPKDGLSFNPEPIGCEELCITKETKV